MAEPLAGKKVVITRAREQASILARRIVELGGEVIEFPTIEIRPPADFDAFDRCVACIESYDWLIFTSVNSIDPFLARLRHVGKSVANLSRVKVAAIGSETAKRLKAASVSVALVPERYQAEGILESFSGQDLRGKKILIPRAAKAREVLRETLRQWGAQVDVVEAYRTVVPDVDIAAMRQRLQQGGLDVITFTSSSTVNNFARLFTGADLASIAGKAAIACIGPITAKSVEEQGGRVAIMAREFTAEGLVQAIVEYFQSVNN